MKSSLAVFLSGSQLTDPPLSDPKYLKAYEELARQTTALGASFAFVRGQHTYLGGNRFAGGWHWTTGETFEYSPDVVEAEVIYNKGEVFLYDESATVVNVRELDDLCRNKFKTYEEFPSLFPKTLTVEHVSELENALDQIPSEVVVLKPLDKWGGEGVIIEPKEKIPRQSIVCPVLVQEFLDTSEGIPGITDRHHDFRVIAFNNTMRLSLLRIPKQGRLVANVSMGGAISCIPNEQIPVEVEKLFDCVDQTMRKFGKRVYSMDCARTKDGVWKLIELNPQPGLPLAGSIGERVASEYLRDLALFLLTEE